MVPIFHMNIPRMSATVNHMFRYLYGGWGEKVRSILKWRDFFPRFADAVRVGLSGCPFPNLIGFVDGSLFEICAPGGTACHHPNLHHKMCYSGNKKKYAVQIMARMLPIGVVVATGIFRGAEHDNTMLTATGWARDLAQVRQQGGGHFAVYGDKGAFPYLGPCPFACPPSQAHPRTADTNRASLWQHLQSAPT